MPILEKAAPELLCGKETTYLKVTQQGQKAILREGAGWPCPVSDAELPGAQLRQVGTTSLLLKPFGGDAAPRCAARTGPSLSEASFILSRETLPKSSQVVTFGDMTKLGWVQLKDLSEVKYHFQAPWPPSANNINTNGKYFLIPRW